MEISPSYLNAKDLTSFIYRIDGYNKEAKNKIKYLHVDIMDGKFVLDNGVDIETIAQVKNRGYKADVHLMVESPETYIDRAIFYGADILTIHIEVGNTLKLIQFIKDKSFEYMKKVKVGISINPETPYKVLEPFLHYIDHILIMSVEPGKGGQKYIELMDEKIENIKNMLINSAIYDGVTICVDGGINNTNIKNIKNKGADMVVIGSYLTKTKNTEEFIERMKEVE